MTNAALTRTQAPAAETAGTSRPLAGRVALVTGASRGIGAAIARELAAAGATLVANYARNGSAAWELVEEVRSAGTEAIALQADVSDPAQAQELVQNAVAAYGGVDILINNAGITRDRTLKNLEPELWREVLSTNLDSVYFCTRAALPHMLARGYGRIVNISSIIGQAGGFGQTNYAASKAGIIGFTKAVATEVARHNITVNAVCPGFIETDMLAEVPEKVRETIRARIPLGRFGQPEEVARAVRFLVVEGDWITGQTLNINGGQYM